MFQKYYLLFYLLKFQLCFICTGYNVRQHNFKVFIFNTHPKVFMFYISIKYNEIFSSLQTSNVLCS